MDGHALKDAGQARSLWPCTDLTRADFTAIIEAIPTGQTFTVNTIRPALDAAEIPDRMRGGLMNAVCREGLCQPLKHLIEGVLVPVVVPSTGPSAHAASVRVYRKIS